MSQGKELPVPFSYLADIPEIHIQRSSCSRNTPTNIMTINDWIAYGVGLISKFLKRTTEEGTARPRQLETVIRSVGNKKVYCSRPILYGQYVYQQRWEP
jgi:hypothetical protein